MDPVVARRMWTVLEPYHAMIYFALEPREAYAAVGLKGFWMGYFASRAAPLGAASAQLVAATFFNFHPRMVARAIPDAWRLATPERVLEARLDAADRALRRLLGDEVATPDVVEAAALAREAAERCDLAGRPLHAANRALAWPSAPHLALWHAATLLREFRGDGHVAALTAAGLDGCEAHVTLVAGGSVPREALQPNRGWTDEEWSAAEARLVSRGWLDDAGALSETGRAGRAAIEEQTDRLALPPWQSIGEGACTRLHGRVRRLSVRIVEQGGVPIPNAMGVPAP